jgi:hypothetical protein
MGHSGYWNHRAALAGLSPLSGTLAASDPPLVYHFRNGLHKRDIRRRAAKRYVDDFYPSEILIRGPLATLEEFLEMSGVVLFIYSLLSNRPRTQDDIPGATRQ